jgi:hypothetical protein
MTTVGTSYNVAPNAAQTGAAPVTARTQASIPFNLSGTMPDTPVGSGIDMYNLSVSNLCPVVGYAYQITFAFSYSINFAGVPSAVGGPNVGVSLSYGTDSGANVLCKSVVYGYTPVDPYFVAGNMTLIFNHTSTANKLIISNINNTNQIISGTGSNIQIQNVGVISLGPITSTIPTSVFTLG